MNRPVAFLPAGQQLYDWLAEGGIPTRGGRLALISYRWRAFWFERALYWQNKLPMEGFRPLRDPIFIVGLWRSGTTWLHDLLARFLAVRTPTTWQCMNPASYRIYTPTRERSVERPMDATLVTTSSPQEDEFALLALGVPSVYRGFLDPRRLTDLSALLYPSNWKARTDSGWIALWANFIAGIGGHEESHVLLKSPNHTFRMLEFAERLPNSRFVWIARDPNEIYLSNKRMWQRMFQRYALWNWNCNGGELDTFLAAALESATAILAIARDALPRERFVVLRFQDLIGHPYRASRQVASRFACQLRAEPPLDQDDSEQKNSVFAQDYNSALGSLPSVAIAAIASLKDEQEEALLSHGL